MRTKKMFDSNLEKMRILVEIKSKLDNISVLLDKRLVGEQYKSLITEAMSVSSNVDNVANAIFNFICENPCIKEIRNIGFIGFANLKHKVVDFDNEEEVNNFVGDCEYVINSNSYVDKSSKKMHNILFNMEYATLNGGIVDMKLLDLLYHEVGHAYKDYCKLLNDVDIFGLKRDELYKFALDFYGHGNKYLSAIAFILYMSNWEEQDSYVTQLYSELIKNEKIHKSNLYFHYHHTDAYKRLNFLLTLQKDLPNWDENNQSYVSMKQQLMLYGIKFDKNQIIELLNNTIRRFRTKMGKVFARVMAEKNITEHVLLSRKTLNL